MTATALIGPAATGKTTRLRSFITKQPACNDPFPRHGALYLTPLSGQRMRQQYGLPEYLQNRIHSISSLAWQIRRFEPRVDGLPPGDKGYYDWSEREREAVSDKNNRVLENAVRMLSESSPGSILSVTTILLDDFEATGQWYWPFLAALQRHTGADLVIAGDPHRLLDDERVDDLSEAYRSRLTAFLSPMGITTFQETHLTTNHRSQPRVHQFVSELLEQASRTTDSPSWTRPRETTPVRHRWPMIRFFTNRHEEYQYLLSQIRRITRGTILVQAHRRRHVKMIRDRLREDGVELDGRIRVETIHRATPIVADNVFVMQASFPADRAVSESVGWARLYSAASRARRRVEVLSAEPYSEFSSLKAFHALRFTCEIKNTQTTVQKMFTRFPVIRGDRRQYLTQKKLGRSAIDSIDLKVRSVNAPFVPRVPEHGEPIPWAIASKTERGFRDESGFPSVTVRRKGDHHVFEFRDLTGLKRAGYNDRNIVRRVTNYVLWYFDQRIPVSAIEVHRIDLCRFLFATAKPLSDFSANLFDSPERTPAKSLYLVGGDDSSAHPLRAEELKVALRRGEGKKKTLYANYGTMKDNLTFRMYDPRQKQNKNAIRQTAYKLEVQVSGQRVNRKYALGSAARVDRLLSRLRDNADFLHAGFDRLYKRFLGAGTPDSVPAEGRGVDPSTEPSSKIRQGSVRELRHSGLGRVGIPHRIAHRFRLLLAKVYHTRKVFCLLYWNSKSTQPLPRPP